jgi:three-Cys-motif partner protein
MSSSNSFFKEKRPWSRIKDEVLKAYLVPYLAKVSRTRCPIIVADCFAGKGCFDNGEPGSPLIIAEAISHQLADPTTQAIKAVFIEKKYFKNLKANIPQKTWCHLLDGDYEEKMDYFVNNYPSRNQNLLLYVDPYGIKSILFSYFDKIHKKKNLHSVELLLNLNTFGFLREACRLLKFKILETDTPEDYEPDINSPERLDEIAGGTYWREIIGRYNACQIKMPEAEELFITKYCERLRTVFRYVVNIPIKAKISHIPKYRIVFATDHVDALLLMVDNMNRRWADFREEARNNQSPLIECDFPDPSKQGACWDIENEIVSLIDTEIELKELLVRLAQKFGINFSTKDYKDCLKNMVNNQIEVTRIPPLTLATGRPSISWDHTKKDLSIKISRRAQWQPPLL